ncbi:MAG TPA: VCBS repeat-containing protein [Pyrinomonadaceae bacterium]|nr:VCBS repeat-containing protein [Pyrinomonadaceae bacterium]
MRSLVLFVLVFIALSITQTSALAQSASFSRTDHPSLGNNHIVADVNGDAILDLIGTGTNSVGVMLGNGNGAFRTRVNFPTGGPPQDVAAGDFNGDGRTDLAVSINDPATMLSLLTGNGDGTFNLTTTVANTSKADSPAIVATDLNNDGRLDLVLAHVIGCFTAPCIASQDITVLLGLGDGTFQQPFDFAVGTGMSRIAVGDFNRDGIKDLAIAGDNSRVYNLLGIGNGSFLKQPDITLTADTLFVDGTDVDIADLNRDSIQDLVVAIPLNGSRTAILLGRGDGSFGAPSILTEPSLLVPQYQVVADFNRDGFLDIAMALANGNNGLMEIRNGNGDGTFRSPVRYFTPPAQSSIGGGTLASGDFNRDGRVDIALPIVGANPALAVALNTTGATVVQPPPPTTTDTVNITRAEYDRGKRVLRVEATSTRSSATLRVFVTSTGQLLGTMSSSGGGQYRGEFSASTNPQNITVRSSLGGVATRSVVVK